CLCSARGRHSWKMEAVVVAQQFVRRIQVPLVPEFVIPEAQNDFLVVSRKVQVPFSGNGWTGARGADGGSNPIPDCLQLQGAFRLRSERGRCDYIPIKIRIPAINATAAITAGGNGRAIIPVSPSRISQIANNSIPALRVMRTAIVHLREGAFRIGDGSRLPATRRTAFPTVQRSGRLARCCRLLPWLDECLPRHGTTAIVGG